MTDKQPLGEGELSLDEETHTYSLADSDEEFTSVTTWIKKHFPGFDPHKEFYHRSLGKTTLVKYVAHAVREEIRSGEEELIVNNYPRSAKLFGDQWETEVLERRDKKIPVRSTEVEQLWNDKGRLASEEGTRVHEAIEYFIKDFEPSLHDLADDDRVQQAMQFLLELENDGVRGTLSPEVRVYSADLGLAGTIDLIIETDEGVYLVDWKVSDTDFYKSYEKGLTPETEELNDSKLSVYSLQINTYAYLLEKYYGRRIKGLWVYQLSEEDPKAYEVDYDPDFIESMLRRDERI